MPKPVLNIRLNISQIKRQENKYKKKNFFNNSLEIIQSQKRFDDKMNCFEGKK